MLAVAMYLANQNGSSVEAIANALAVPVDWALERIEAGRLCVEHQISCIELH